MKQNSAHEIASRYLGRPLDVAFMEKFRSTAPETINRRRNLLIVASELDESSRRIVKYLAGDWLLDQEEVIERSEARTDAPWSGYWYVNCGHDPEVRSWDDMKEYGFVSAGYGRTYSTQLERLAAGDRIFVYHRGAGYEQPRRPCATSRVRLRRSHPARF